MKPKKLSVKKLAVVFGTFAPMHIGHVNLITKAKRANDAVLVIVSGTNTDRDRGTREGLHLNRRFRYVREVFNDDELVVVDKLDEEGMPAYPDGWQPWLVELHKMIAANTDYSFSDLTFYIGEEEYQDPLLEYFAKTFKSESKKHFPKKKVYVKLMERSSIPVSATDIRKNSLENWRYITKPFRRHFTRKVLVVGSASGGKTTLVKDLGRVFNAPISLEYARTYQQVYNVRDDELDTNDYIRLFANQNEQTANVIDGGNHSGIIFADTNATVTMAYDLIVLIPPKTTYVDDGFRDMSMSEQSIREDFTNHLIHLLKRDGFEKELVILDSSIENFFEENYEKTVEAIKDRLGIII